MPLPPGLQLARGWEDVLTVVGTLCFSLGVCGHVVQSSDIGLVWTKAIICKLWTGFFRCLRTLTFHTGIQVHWLPCMLS